MPGSFEDRFLKRWSAADWRQTRILLACSGGPDSTALLRLLVASQPRRDLLLVGHFNHGLREAESDADEAFVRQLSQSLGVACVVGRAAPTAIQATQAGEGLESAARTHRYKFLIETAEQRGARYVATAHHADDQAETVLHHILRGTGLAGLSGIPAVRAASPAVSIIRPLLQWSRQEVEAYLQSIGQASRYDEHNSRLDLTRNRIRHELLPLLREQYHPAVRESLLKLSRAAHETQSLLAEWAEELLSQAISQQSATHVSLIRAALVAAPPLLQRESFVALWRRQDWPAQAMTFTHWQDLAAAIRGNERTPARNLPGSIRLTHHRDWLQLSVRVGPRPPSPTDE